MVALIAIVRVLGSINFFITSSVVRFSLTTGKINYLLLTHPASLYFLKVQEVNEFQGVVKISRKADANQCQCLP